MNSYPQFTRSSNLIDVNQNVGILSSSYRPSGDQHALELQEQIKTYKRELAKKDGLIAQLSTTSPHVGSTDLVDAMMGSASPRISRRITNIHGYDSSHAELASAKMKIDNFSSEIHELRSKLGLKENSIHELRSKIQLMNDSSARQNALIQTLKDQLQQSEHQSGTLEQITSKGSVTIQTLQRENREAQEKVVELESRLRNHVLNREETEQEADTFKRKYYDAVTQIGDALNTDTESGHLEDAVQILVEKAKEVTQDQLLLQSKVQTLEDELDSHGLETKTNKETISRLLSEVGKEQRSVSEASHSLERLRKERDDAVLVKESLEREIEMLKDRMITNDRTWASSREELTQTATRANMLNDDVKRLEYEKNVIKGEFNTFCESMAKILSDPYVEVMPREDSIKDRIRELSTSERERKSQVDLLEAKVLELTNQLERQCELHQDSIRRARKAETSTYQKDNRLLDYENELVSGDIIRETWRSDQTKYTSFMRQMAQALRMDDLSFGLESNISPEVLLAKARQLSKLESDDIAEKTSSNYELHRKVKGLKEQLKHKEMHLELLRQKLSQVEEKEQTHNALAIDRDDAVATVQRLHRKVERLQHALGDERVKVQQLKAKLAEHQQLKAVTLEQRRKIDELTNSVGKLSTAKERQRRKLSSLKHNFTTSEMYAGESNSILRSQLDAITNDLRTTKSLLEEVNQREKRLIDFREVISRMLGLDVTTMTIPDYEIISRLEKLVREHHVGAAAGAALDRSLDGMSSHFRSGYEKGAYDPPSHTRYYTPSPPHCSRGRESSLRRHHRSRSLSPRRY